MMKCRFPFLTAGYLGETIEIGTLNSRFYGLLLDQERHLTTPIIFPQRVPKTGFFSELLELESQSELTTIFLEIGAL